MSFPLRAVMLALFLVPGRAGADGLDNMLTNVSADNLYYVFPNWQLTPVTRFDLSILDDIDGLPDCPITSLTVMNYGTADQVNDITGVYLNLQCGKTDAWRTMDFAGVWTVEGQDLPTWTWADPAGIPWEVDPDFGCDGLATLTIHVDIGPCPTDGATVAMGMGYNGWTAWPGGLFDYCGYWLPFADDEQRVGKEKYIRYVVKTADRDYAAPADTITYEIYFGRPGGPSISEFVITDSLPAYTHYVSGSASYPPDPLWAPDPGPPPRLRWTMPGVASTAGGATTMISYSVTVDWGNGDTFEPGSGDVAAPEGIRLDNRAAVEALGSGCASAHINPPAETIVRRYRVWKLGDQDLLFAPRVGYPDDELTYSIFIRNQSTKKTWWNISVWDTVPPELTTWVLDQGFSDPFLGWTMTPTPAAAGHPGWVESAPGVTLLTWIFDLPPTGTIELKWKASAGTAASMPGAMAVTKVSVMEQGSPGKVDGTGHSMYPRCFTHLASIALRTTYFSYVGQAADGGANILINFYPLNRATSFDMRKLAYTDEPLNFADVGGLSESIVDFQGTCAGFIDGGYGGCGVERAPAQYSGYAGPGPAAFLYKLTGNAPLLWLLMPNGIPGDAFTYIPSTSLNFSGFCHYSYRRDRDDDPTPGKGESWIVFNTSIDPEGNFNPDLATTAHTFRWDFANLKWNYVNSADIAPTSLWMPFAGCAPWDENHYKIISSDARMVVYQGYGTIGEPTQSGTYNEHGGLVPCAQNGLNTSLPGEPATFYAVAHHDPSCANIVVGNNNETAPARFRLYRYVPRNPNLASPGIPPTLAGTVGSWAFMGERVADPGLAGPKNPYAFGQADMYDPISRGAGTTANAWKVEWVSGGNLSVNCGQIMFNLHAGGAPMHPVSGEPVGDEFWFHRTHGWDNYTWGVLIFCPSTGMAIRASDAYGYDSSYTTDGPDQCVFFKALTDPGRGGYRVWKFELLEDGAQGEMMAMYHQPRPYEKFFTAPFVATGVHYDVIAPATAFVGQPFWITIAVILGEGGTKLDYTGISVFTSTDPTAQIEFVPMELFQYDWQLTDEGVKLFLNVVMEDLGHQSIVVNDTLDGSITGLATVFLVGVDVKFVKEPRFGVASSGEEVEFRICWSNYSSGSAENFVITDRVPAHMIYVQQDGLAHFCGRLDRYNGKVAYSTTTNYHSEYQEITNGGPTEATWLRWTIPIIGVNSTGCVCFKARVE